MNAAWALDNPKGTTANPQKTKRGRVRCFGSISLLDSQLMIALFKINLREHGCSFHSIIQVIDSSGYLFLIVALLNIRSSIRNRSG
uniref:Uncharacterized protein n=1 Tax=Picea glauca TaxID=3330 RepID=A0A101LZY6_PICGL|nr:hypothetical protein ABT39_MTgene4511 [Picea glauca]QHR87426.1 hypothetical protein Q903MT_gene1436 [Picea sitchensis]